MMNALVQPFVWLTRSKPVEMTLERELREYIYTTFMRTPVCILRNMNDRERGIVYRESRWYPDSDFESESVSVDGVCIAYSHEGMVPRSGSVTVGQRKILDLQYVREVVHYVWHANHGAYEQRLRAALQILSERAAAVDM